MPLLRKNKLVAMSNLWVRGHMLVLRGGYMNHIIFCTRGLRVNVFTYHLLLTFECLDDDDD